MHSNVVSAFEAIHNVGVHHGDVAARNILVREDKSVVVIDFGMSSVGLGKEMLLDEADEVKNLLRKLEEE